MIVKKVVPAEALTKRLNIKYFEELREISRRNRKNPTNAEYKVWCMVLRKRNMTNKFLRQKPIGRYILDFYCSKIALDIEIDGDSHDSKFYQDQNRDKYLEIRGIKTIRFSNYQVFNNIEKVTTEIFKIIKEREKELLFSPFSRENAPVKLEKRV